jgi:hypothetical protein
MLDVVGFADHVEAHLAGESGIAIARLLGELNAIVGEDRVDPIGHGLEQVLQELPGRLSVGFVDQLRDRELARAVDADEQVEVASVNVV